MKEQRIVCFDYLRLLAILAVVVIHVTAFQWKRAAVDTLEWQALNLYDGMSRWAVPVFVMISGALFLGKEQPLRKIYKKNILRMVVTYFFWSALYVAAAYFLFHKNYSAKEAVIKIIKGHYHLWFLLMIAGLYMIVPFLNRIVSDRKTAIYFVVLAFVFSFFLPQFLKILGYKFVGAANLLSIFVSKLRVKMVVGYSGYFVLGYLLHTSEIKKKWRITAYVVGALAILFTVGATAFVAFWNHSRTTFFYENMTVNTLLAATGVFLFVKTHWNKPSQSLKKQEALAFFSKCTFGVFLIHPFLLDVAEKYLNLTPVTFNPLLFVPVLALVIYIASMLVSILLNKIPLVKTWLV